MSENDEPSRKRPHPNGDRRSSAQDEMGNGGADDEKAKVQRTDGGEEAATEREAGLRHGIARDPSSVSAAAAASATTGDGGGGGSGVGDGGSVNDSVAEGEALVEARRRLRNLKTEVDGLSLPAPAGGRRVARTNRPSAAESARNIFRGMFSASSSSAAIRAAEAPARGAANGAAGPPRVRSNGVAQRPLQDKTEAEGAAAHRHSGRTGPMGPSYLLVFALCSVALLLLSSSLILASLLSTERARHFQTKMELEGQVASMGARLADRERRLRIAVMALEDGVQIAAA